MTSLVMALLVGIAAYFVARHDFQLGMAYLAFLIVLWGYRATYRH